MKIQDLQDGDLIFTVGSSEIATAIRAATGSYSHVAIFFNGEIYHATQEKGVINQNLSDFWQGYYRDLSLVVPIGQPGTNPSQLAQSRKLIYKGELHD